VVYGLLLAGFPSLAQADYDLGPIEVLVRQEAASVIDATITRLTPEGDAQLEIHEVVTAGPAARKLPGGPKKIKTISLSCKGSPPVGTVLKEKKRYLLLLTGDMLYEASTAWEVLRAADGQWLVNYVGSTKPKDPMVPLLPGPGLYDLSILKRHLRHVAGQTDSTPADK
jgi:hypothetical protein